jgi:acetyltransferase
MATLDSIFNPKTIAVIGASNRKGGVGYALFKNLIGSNFEGIVYPVNPKRNSVQGVKAYPNIAATPDTIDLAIIATPAQTVPGIVDECGKAGVKGLVIISAGFTESGNKALSEQIVDFARNYDMRIIGPNCLGFIRPSIGLNASFANKMALPGRIAFISQSGALCTSILDWSVKQNVGFSHFVSIGSMIDVGFHDLIDYFGSDQHTTSILIYMESLQDARRFMSAARAFTRTKPIILIKVGKSAQGAKAALSHTGSIAGNDSIYDAAFKRAGIIRVDTIEELFDSAKTLAMQRRPSGNRLAIVTNAGGPAVIATDALIDLNGVLARLSNETMKRLNELLPAAWSMANPIDMLGDAMAGHYKRAVELCLNDPEVDGIVIILTPQQMTDPADVARAIVELEHKKPMLAVWMGGDDILEGRLILEKGRVPVYNTPEMAVKCFMLMYNYSKNLELLYETPATVPHAFVPKTSANRQIIQAAVAQGRYTLDELESKRLLANYMIPIARHSVARSADEASAAAAKIGFPVVMKILSPDILHKTNIGGVRAGICSKEEAREAHKALMSAARKKAKGARIHGIFIEQMASKKYELLIGCKKDPVFGPAIVFGMGGVAVEVFKDTTVGLPPLNMALSMRLIEGTKIYNLLRGHRGMPGVDIRAIQFLLYKFAYLVMDFPEIQEIDINPFAVDEKGGIVLDAKVILDRDVIATPVKPYSHMVISAYPREYVTTFKMKNGQTALLRPIRPEDEPLEAEMFTRFSDQTQRFRFFTRLKDITHELLVRYTQIDYDREIAVIAEVKERKKKKMAGVVRLIADPYNLNAEFAIVVADPWHGQGLGNKLADYILEIAMERGIRKVFANFLPENYIMRHMLQKRGFKLSKQQDTFYAELELKR